MSDAASADSSEFSEDKSERTYATHYQWSKKPDGASPAKDAGINTLRLDNPADLYDFAHHIHHDTQPCTPLLNKQRSNTIYGQVRCTCPHVTQATYVRASDLRPPGSVPTVRPGNAIRENVDDGVVGVNVNVGATTNRVGSHYLVLDPDVIADQRTHPVQLRTFGPPKQSSNADREELYAMRIIKHPTVAPSGGDAVVLGDKNKPTAVNCRPPANQRCPHTGPEGVAPGASHEDLDNNENERRKPDTLN